MIKAYFFILITFINFKANALDESVFSGQYPNVLNFQKILLAPAKNYFEALPIQSIYSIDPSGVRVFQVPNKDSLGFDTVYAKIERQVVGRKLLEIVYYSLANGTRVSFKVVRVGENLAPSLDQDLLFLNFKPGKSDESYSLEVAEFGLLTKIEKETGVVSILDMGFELKIESAYNTLSAQRNYIYFYKGMPTPQSSLTVKAQKNESKWGQISYSHFGSFSGELSPNAFFLGLSQGSSLYEELGKEYLSILEMKGFPSFD